jgi:hypothetical protein
MKNLLLVLCLFSLSQRADGLEGDQRVEAISQEFDTLTNAYTLFTRIVEERRSVDEVAHSLEVLADKFDTFYSRLAQFVLWMNVDPNATAGFSNSGRARMDNLFNRTLPKPPQLDALMTPYQSDQRIIAVRARMRSSYNTFEQLSGSTQQ